MREEEDLQRAIGRVEGKIDMLLDRQKEREEHCVKCGDNFDSLQGKVSQLEQAHAATRTTLYTVGAVAGFLGMDFVTKYFENLWPHLK
jgi:hypothetical protein